MTTKYLDLKQVLWIHDKMIQRYGGSAGVRDPRLLESALVRPAMSAFGEDAYPTLELKAAALFHSLIKNHPFVDGNKRAAFGAMHMMLMLNGRDLKSSAAGATEFSLSIAASDFKLEHIAIWIQKNSSPFKK